MIQHGRMVLIEHEMEVRRWKKIPLFILSMLVFVIESVSCIESGYGIITPHDQIRKTQHQSYLSKANHDKKSFWLKFDERFLREAELLQLRAIIEEHGASSSSISRMNISSLKRAERLPSLHSQKRNLQTRTEKEQRTRHHDNTTDRFPSRLSKDRHRIVIMCDKEQSQGQCRSKLLDKYGSEKYQRHVRCGNDNHSKVKVIHDLVSIHALSIEVDSDVLARLYLDGEFVVQRDEVREPLVVEGSVRYHESRQLNENRKFENEQDISEELPWGVQAIQAPKVWEHFSVRGEGVKICILDTGVEASHEDFRQSNLDGYYGTEFVSPFWYEDNRGHGTHITGTIAASHNFVGIVGIAPEVETFIVRVFDDNRNLYDFAGGTTFSTDLIAAATICKEWGADIINASLGGKTYNQVEEEFFQNLFYNSGILTVAAAGNGGNTQNMFPAAYDGVISVAAASETLELASFSTWNPMTTDVLAPGVNILSTLRGNQYASFSGSSMAAPHVSGALALMVSFIKKTEKIVTSEEIFVTLKQSIVMGSNITEDDLNVSNDDPNSLGIIDVYAAIQALAGNVRETTPQSRWTFKDPSEGKTTCANEVRLDISTDNNGNETFYRLKRISDDEIIWITYPNSLENYSFYSETYCLDVIHDCYQFDVRDVGGDGISEQGGIKLTYQGSELYYSGTFGYGGFIRFGNCGHHGEIP